MSATERTVIGDLGYVGRPIDKPLVQRATDLGGNPPLRSRRS